MFQRQGVILEGGVQIGLRQMPGITSFGEQTKISQTQVFDQRGFVFEGIALGRLTERGMGQQQA